MSWSFFGGKQRLVAAASATRRSWSLRVGDELDAPGSSYVTSEHFIILRHVSVCDRAVAPLFSVFRCPLLSCIFDVSAQDGCSRLGHRFMTPRTRTLVFSAQLPNCT